MKILVACEHSGRVREAFRAKGHNAWSCDILPASDNSPYHYQRYLEDILGNEWDMIIAFPPCTFLCGSGIHWNNRGRGWERTEEALTLIRLLLSQSCKVAIENPVGIISSRIRKPDQIIQPYQFGEDASKKTCLWLKGLTPLITDPSKRFAGRLVTHNGKQVERWSNQTDSGQNKLGPSDTRAHDRAITYQGIADAMAANWG